MNNELRAEIFSGLEQADLDDEVRVTIVRGTGKAFCSGYGLTAKPSEGQPYHTARGAGRTIAIDVRPIANRLRLFTRSQRSVWK